MGERGYLGSAAGSGKTLTGAGSGEWGGTLVEADGACQRHGQSATQSEIVYTVNLANY